MRHATWGRSKGSVLFYTLGFVMSMTTIVVATHTLSTSAATTQNRYEQKMVAEAARDGAIDKLQAEWVQQGHQTPETVTYTIGRATVTATAVDNSTVVPRTMIVSTQVKLPWGVFEYENVVTQPFVPHPIYYTLAVNSNEYISARLEVGDVTSDGSVYIGGNLTLTDGATRVRGDIDTTGTLSLSGSADGATTQNAKSVSFPTSTSAEVLGAAILTSGSDNGRTFSTSYTSRYPAVIRLGNYNFRGTVTNKGTIFVTGDLTISGDITYANSNSAVAFIVGGDIKVNDNVRNIAGFFYCEGEFKWDRDGSYDRKLTRGAIASRDLDIDSDDVTLIYDPLIWNDPAEGKKLRIPGF